MKIALISLARRGAMVHFQAELANALSAISPTVVIGSSEAPAPVIDPAIYRSTVNAGRNSLESLASAANPLTWHFLRRVLLASEADVFHIVGAHEWNPLVGVLIRMLRKPLVFTMHDPVSHPGTSLSMRFSNRVASTLADAIVVMTRSGRDELIRRGLPPGKLRLIPHGVYFYFTRWRRTNVKTKKVVLCFGRMEPYKGLDVLVAAFEQVHRRLPSWRLVLAGSGVPPRIPSHDETSGVVLINRYIADEEVAGFMQRARMVVVPYTTATQSGAVATAYAFGKPVIATDVGGLKEMVLHGKTGLLVPPNDVPALARAIKLLATDSNRASAMGKYAMALGRTKWSWKSIAEQHRAMYKRVLAAYETR
jgi:starch synthase